MFRAPNTAGPEPAILDWYGLSRSNLPPEVNCPPEASCFEVMRLSMVCLTWHTWGRCWRKKGNLALESSPRGWYLVGIVKTSRKIHEQPWGLMTIVTTDLYTSSTQIAYIFSFIMLKCLWKIPQIPIHPCHTLYTRGRYGVLVRDM